MARQTALYDRHISLGARMIDFAGWLLPVQYATGPKAEHLRVRESAGLFDIDHMGQVIVRGPDALRFMQRIMTANVAAFAPGSANYALMCYADGGIVDDTFIYTFPDHYFIAINAANNAKDTRWMKLHALDLDVTIENVSDQTYMLALQGPRAQDILQPLVSENLHAMPYHTALNTQVAGIPTLLGRTGYTGEDGFELFFPTTEAVLMWDQLMESGRPHGLVPVGLAARDSLRFEAALPLYGQEITATTDPISAGLGWAVALEKPEFSGREALIKTRLEGPRQKLIGFRMTEGGVPRHGYPVVINGVTCGEVTSGMYAPTLGEFLGMAYVPTEYSHIGASIGILIRDKVKPAIVVKRPFYTPAYRRE